MKNRGMVLPLVDEDKPKCYLCHRGFSDIGKLREHQKGDHADHFDADGDGGGDPNTKKEPAPGDVTIF